MNHYRARLLEIIEKYLPTARVYLYGSRARNTHQEGADIDIALDTGSKIETKDILRILSDIEDSFIPVFVDVVDFNAIPDEMKKEILKDRVIWKS